MRKADETIEVILPTVTVKNAFGGAWHLSLQNIEGDEQKTIVTPLQNSENPSLFVTSVGVKHFQAELTSRYLNGRMPKFISEDVVAKQSILIVTVNHLTNIGQLIPLCAVIKCISKELKLIGTCWPASLIYRYLEFEVFASCKFNTWLYFFRDKKNRVNGKLSIRHNVAYIEDRFEEELSCISPILVDFCRTLEWVNLYSEL